MATSRKRVRLSMDVKFTSEAEKDAFCEKLSDIREQLTPRGTRAISNYELLLSLFNLVGSGSGASVPSSSQQIHQCPSRGSFLENSGQSVIILVDKKHCWCEQTIILYQEY